MKIKSKINVFGCARSSHPSLGAIVQLVAVVIVIVVSPVNRDGAPSALRVLAIWIVLLLIVWHLICYCWAARERTLLRFANMTESGKHVIGWTQRWKYTVAPEQWFRIASRKIRSWHSNADAGAHTERNQNVDFYRCHVYLLLMVSILFFSTHFPLEIAMLRAQY